MAFQHNFLRDEDEDTGPGVASALSSTAPGAAAPSASAPTAVKNGTGFTNLNEYATANVEQAGENAGVLTGAVQSDIDKGRTGLASIKSSVDQTATDNANDAPDVVNTLNTNPGQFHAPDYVAKFAKATAGFKGPDSVATLTPYQDVTTAFTNAGTNNKNLDSLSGRASMFATQAPTDGQRTAGGNRLDSFLAGSGQGAARIKDFQTGAGNIGAELTNTTAGLNDKLAGIRATANKSKDDTLAAYSTAVTKARSPIDLAFEKANAEKVQYGAKARSGGDLVDKRDRAAFEALAGLNPGIGAYDFSASGNVDPARFNAGGDLQKKGATENSFISGPGGNQAAAVPDAITGKRYDTLASGFDAPTTPLTQSPEPDKVSIDVGGGVETPEEILRRLFG